MFNILTVIPYAKLLSRESCCESDDPFFVRTNAKLTSATTAASTTATAATGNTQLLIKRKKIVPREHGRACDARESGHTQRRSSAQPVGAREPIALGLFITAGGRVMQEFAERLLTKISVLLGQQNKLVLRGVDRDAGHAEIGAAMVANHAKPRAQAFEHHRRLFVRPMRIGLLKLEAQYARERVLLDEEPTRFALRRR